MSKNLTFLEHLEELRSRLLWVTGSLVVCSVFTFFSSDTILTFILRPTKTLYSQLYFFAPYEAFIVKIKVTLFSGFILSLPMVFYQIGVFIVPALRDKERVWIFRAVIAATFLFLTGAFLAHFVVIPFSLRFLLAFQTENLVPMLSMSVFLSFILMFYLGFGLIFVLPLLLTAMMSLGIFTLEDLKRFRRIAFASSFILAAILTPPDVYSQCLMGFPLYILYELTILLGSLTQKK